MPIYSIIAEAYAKGGIEGAHQASIQVAYGYGEEWAVLTGGFLGFSALGVASAEAIAYSGQLLLIYGAWKSGLIAGEAIRAHFIDEDAFFRFFEENFGLCSGGLLDDFLQSRVVNSVMRFFGSLIDVDVDSTVGSKLRDKVICNCATTSSPIVLDLDGDGVETIGLGNSEVMFDLDGDGRRTLTGWLNADDGFLVYDRDGNGLITDGREMFGNNTYRYDGPGFYVNGFENSGSLERCEGGFEALAQEDTNGDGVLNHLDRNWFDFRIWRDLNQDGVSQAEELFTLDDLGIAEIGLD